MKISNRFLSLPISVKLPILIVAAALLSGGIVGGVASWASERQLRQATENRLISLLEDRHAMVETLLQSIVRDLRAMAHSPSIRNALSDFVTGWQGYGFERTKELQAAYITANPFPPGEKLKLDRSENDTYYDKVHGRHHPAFRNIQKEYGYEDVLLFDNAGNLIYSTQKRQDFATSFVQGPWSESILGDLVKSIRAAPEQTGVIFTDFALYAPNRDRSSSFLAVPLFDSGDEFSGILAVQMSVERLNDVLGFKGGMGQSGEIYLVGADRRLRSAARFLDPSAVLTAKIDNSAVDRALKGEDGVYQGWNYRERAVITAYRPVEFLGTRWALIGDVETDEVFAPILEFRTLGMTIGVGILLLIAAMGTLVARSIALPIATMTEAMRRLAAGDLAVAMPKVRYRDEVGAMAQAMAVFKSNALEMQRLNEERWHVLEEAERIKREALHSLAQHLEEGVSSVVTGVNAAAHDMTDTAATMAHTASVTSTQSTAASTAARYTAEHVACVAVAAEQLSQAIGDIGRQINRATGVAQQAVVDASSTNHTVSSLCQAAERIGHVVDFITNLAAKTNLLALNATIEAARAGEAGRGFAVVAQEVKMLATQTAHATGDIVAQIRTIQETTQSVVEAIGGITDTIETMDAINSHIATAIEQQNAATRQIAASIQQASVSTDTVSGNIGGVSGAANDTGQAAESMLDFARKLSNQSRFLQTELDRFMSRLRSAA